MQLDEILQPGCVKVPLEATQKKAAIFELVDLLAEQGLLSEIDQVKEAVWMRETTRTTGIGHGLAIPHAKTASCENLIMAVGKPQKPIDFEAIDAKLVNIIILLVSPQDKTGPHIQALAKISRMMTQVDFRTKVASADNAEDLYRLIIDADAQISTAG